MTLRLPALLAASVFAAICAHAPAIARQSDTLTLSIAPGEAPVLYAMMDGEPVRLEFSPDVPRLILLNADAAERLELRSNPVLSLGVRLSEGEAESTGDTARVAVRPDGAPEFRRRALWFEGRSFSAVADGVIGAAAFEGLERVVVEIEQDEAADPGRQIEAVFRGERDFDWTIRHLGVDRLFDLHFSFVQHSSLEGEAAAHLQRTGWIGRAQDDLALERFWHFGEEHAFVHPNLGLRFDGLEPDRFLRFATADQVEQHRVRVDFEAARGPVETMDVLAPGVESDAPLQATLGRDVLAACTRMVFDFETDEIRVTCPEPVSQF